MNPEPICPCTGFIHPRSISNPPDRDVIAYRVGDFNSFRHALLLPLLDADGDHLETELRLWRPAPNGDLSLQLVEWWAYIADILTFYNERIANEAYLRTAIQPESVRQLIQLLGYRPRPGIGATGVVATLLAPGAKSAVLPQGMGLQNKPSPGKQPQIFEFDQGLTLRLPDAVFADISAEAAAASAVVNFSLSVSTKAYVAKKVSGFPKASIADKDSAPTATEIDSVLLQGEVSGLKPGEALLLVDKSWNGKAANFRWGTLAGTTTEKDARDKANTRIHFAKGFELWTGFDERNTRLLTPAQKAHLWSVPGTVGVINGDKVHLDRLVKQIGVGDMLLFEDGTNADLGKASGYEEVLWYANPLSPATPDKAPATPTPPIAVLHSVVSPKPNFSITTPGTVNIHFAWRDVGQLIAAPVMFIDSKLASGKLSTLSAVGADGAPTAGVTFPAKLTTAKVFIEDVDGQGVSANASTDSTGTGLTLSGLPDQPYTLKPPLRVLFNLAPVSRGKTVNNEVLGSGNASVPGQTFVLKNAPLTYFLSANSLSGDNYRSTLRIWVDGIEWQEAPHFFGSGPKARVFVTREDEAGKTHVLFGDGVNGARLPSGFNNVVANYRFGSGEESPPATSLTVMLQPQPGIKAIRNPVAVGGGADPEPAANIRKLAPRSVLTFGRAVSADDYETIAAQAPGVKRAKSVWSFDATSQRALPIIYVGDDVSAVASARLALSLAADPNRPCKISLAKKIPIQLKLELNIANNYAVQPVIEAVFNLLTELDSGLFGLNKVGIGQAFFQSEIDAVCLKANGVIAVHQIRLFANTGAEFIEETGSKYEPGIDGFYVLALENLGITYEQVAL